MHRELVDERRFLEAHRKRGGVDSWVAGTIGATSECSCSATDSASYACSAAAPLSAPASTW